jgi:preprotein translocase subunit SecA
MLDVLRNLFDDNAREVKRLQKTVDNINEFEPYIRSLSDDELRAKTQEFKERLAEGETLDDILPEAFAVVREAGWRVVGQRPFDVQLMGGIVLHQGRI